MKKPVVLRTKSLDSDRIVCTFICAQVTERSYVVESLVNFLIVGSLSATTVFLDAHTARNDQQNAVACSTASSHEDLREVTSISSSVHLNSQSVFPNIVSQKMDLCLGFRSTATALFHPFILPINSSCWAVNGSFRQPISEMDTTTNLRISFGFHHAVLHEFFIHHDVLGASHTFPTFSQIFPIFPSKALRHVMYSFNSLLLRSPASSSRYQSDTSLI